jgi:hypothetical protein
VESVHCTWQRKAADININTDRTAKISHPSCTTLENHLGVIAADGVVFDANLAIVLAADAKGEAKSEGSPVTARGSGSDLKKGRHTLRPASRHRLLVYNSG